MEVKDIPDGMGVCIRWFYVVEETGVPEENPNLGRATTTATVVPCAIKTLDISQQCVWYYLFIIDTLKKVSNTTFLSSYFSR